MLARRSGGDARIALGALERAAALGDHVDVAAAREALAAGLVRYDRAGDQHYDTISAWIKATRGSDVDASLYYLATMLEGGEDPRFIVRRMVILASEDIGNADPEALVVAVAAAAAVEHVGLPECSYALAQAAIRLSLAPKSDAAGRALSAAPRADPPGGSSPRAGRPARRRRVRQPARPPGSHQRTGADARRARGRPLLRTRRSRGRARRGAGARARRARARVSAAPQEDMGVVTRLWGALRVPDRARYLERAAQAVIDEFDDLCLAIAAESQRPRTEIAALELLASIDALRWLAENSRRLTGAQRFSLPRALHPLTRARAGFAPVGVVGIRGARGAPFAEPLATVGAALLAGNGVVLAPGADAARRGNTAVRRARPRRTPRGAGPGGQLLARALRARPRGGRRPARRRRDDRPRRRARAPGRGGSAVGRLLRERGSSPAR